MIKFLLKGIIRDRSRSLFPVLAVTTGVALTVLLHAWITGVSNNMINSNANFQTGHVKIMSLAYAEQSGQLSNDLALTGLDAVLSKAGKTFPGMIWTPRVRFGGLLDIPDEAGETKKQGPVFGMAVDLLKHGTPEPGILNLNQALVQGRVPEKPGEILISDEFARQLKIRLKETATLISTTMHGSMTSFNFTVAGTVRFGIAAMDRGAIIADIGDIQYALDMENAAGEVLGFFNDFQYNDKKAIATANTFNNQYKNPDDEFSPIMLALRDQNGLAEILDIISFRIRLFVVVFVAVMFIVLWNAGLMSSLRRYGEIGMRLAIGEEKGHIYRSMLWESFMIGLIGTAIGTVVGLSAAYYLQYTGIDMGSMMKSSTMILSNVMRAQVTPASYLIGFIPGLFATLLGSAASGVGIYKRQTSQLFKELET